jgi:hypothetical protein
VTDAVTTVFFAALRHALAAIDQSRIDHELFTWRDYWENVIQNPACLGKPKLLIVARIQSIDDIILHRGMLQILGLSSIQPLVIFALPTSAAVEILSGYARREGWASLVSIATEAELDHAIRHLPDTVPIATFPLPAMISRSVIGQIARFSTSTNFAVDFAKLGLQSNGVFLGSARDYIGLDTITTSSVNELLSAYADGALNTPDPPDSGDLAVPTSGQPTMIDAPHHDLKKEIWVRRSEVELPFIEHGDLLTVTISADGEPDQLTAVQHLGLMSRLKGLSLPILPRHASEAERRMQVRVFDGSAVRTKHEMRFSVPGANIEPWMLTAFLNRGGGGNPVIKAFAAGIGCRLAYAEDETGTLQDAPVVWGVLRGSDRILAQARSQGLHHFYIDHAYFDRGHGHSYRITRNRYEAGAVRKVDDDRLKKLNLSLRPWRKKGHSIVVCPPTDYFMAAHDCADWLEQTLTTLSLETDRPIIVREKPKPGEVSIPLVRALRHAHALVTHSSNVAIEAACLGTPVFVSQTSAAAPIGQTDLGLIETPVYPERNSWLAHLAYSQYSMNEIRDGTAWNIMKHLEDCEFV